jgi:hypothetical protein
MVTEMSTVSDKTIRLIKKSIRDIYNNYGIDVSDMGEDEFGRLIKQYLSGESDLEKDLEESTAHADKYADEGLI